MELQFKPAGEVDYVLYRDKPSESYIETDTRRYGKCSLVYLKHENGKYYSYPKHKLLKVVIDKYELQHIIDKTSEY